MAAAPKIHSWDRLTVVTSVSLVHRYWTDADKTERECRTPLGTARCRCGLFALAGATAALEEAAGAAD